MNRLRAGLVAVGLGLLGVGGTASPVRAECVYGLAYVERENAPTIHVLGPDPCVHSTDWNQVVFVGPTDVGQSGMPDGAPNRVVVEVRVPIP